MCILRRVLFLIAMIFTVSCSLPPTPEGFKECSICRENGDLGCLYIKPTEKTPHLKINNINYYFCSEECKDSFLRKHEHIQ